MKLQFEPNLPHQAEAIAAIVDALREAPRPPGAAVIGPGGSVVVGNVDAEFASGPPLGDIAVEMETGTGKTYVLIRAALELARSHGLRKFVIVVPTVAIREGVLKTLTVTRDHFAALFPESTFRFFEHRGDIGRIARWTRSRDVEFLVLTVDAFNKQSNVLRQPSDRFGGATPLAVMAACRPVLLLDEPHRFASPLRKLSLASLAPLFVIRFGATVGAHPRKVYCLSPKAAHQRGLVKTVEVHAPAVIIEGEPAASAQIEAAIAGHLQLQEQLLPRGIKVLSLFFLARVAEYADADGATRRLFRRHFDALKRDSSRFASRTADEVCAAYFAHSRTRGACAVDSKTGTSLADAEAYALIMRDKERLLSLANPVGFVFSHSALREGWDNPNVFGICTLGRSESSLRKRQELGRGMRLCVDQSGRRVVDPSINVVTIYANESYASYAASLQQEVDATFGAAERPVAPRQASGPRVLRKVDDASVAAGAVRFSTTALLAEAAARLDAMTDAAGSEFDVDAVCRAVGRVLIQRRPPLPLRDDTVAAFVNASFGRGRAPPSVAACAEALAGAVASLQDAGRPSQERVDREQEQCQQ